MPVPNFVIAAPNWSLLGRSEMPEESLLGAIRTAIQSEGREAAVDRVRTMDDMIAEMVSAQRTVAARLPEFAIRSALASTPRALIARVGREVIALVAVGCAIGLAVMVPLQPLLKRFVFDVGPLSVALGAAVFSILFAVGPAAVAVPALRAARIDPIRILRGA